MASLTGVGDSVELQMADKDEAVAIALSGTYNMTILFQREVVPNGGAWQTLRTYTTEDATVAETHVTERTGEKFRLIVSVDTSGTAVATLTDSALEDLGHITIRDRVGNSLLSFFQGGIAFHGGLRHAEGGVVAEVDTTITITAKEHAGRVITLDRASGITATLPAALGTGDIYKFFIGTTVTSNNYIIEVAVAADVMQGMVTVSDSGDATSSDFQTASTSDTITMDGDTKGGKRGDYIELEDVAVGLYRVTGFLAGDATQATPFSAAVS